MRGVESQVTSGFWRNWQEVNAESAIFHQWERLEESGCIDNFRILAENKPVFRRGWFFADSDAYKWLEAASLILGDFPDPRLADLVTGFIQLLRRAQDPDGYLFTFNQVHFPGTRWVNLQIEHELYCHGHLIEAGVSRYQASGERDLLVVALKAADRIAADFTGKGPRDTPGHEEIEIALLRLYEITQDPSYLALARQFLAQRGRMWFFGFRLFKQFISNAQRLKHVETQRAAFNREHPSHEVKTLQPGNPARKPPRIQLRWLVNTLSGKYFQQHQPLARQKIPVGHAVRFAYLQTAGAMLDRLSQQSTYLPGLVRRWLHMVEKRMYLTGGIGSLPVIEGFGRDDELDPEFAYAETCAALGCLFWNREMGKLTGEATYSDLYEWQLYNAALVGMGVDGTTYFYNNPLKADGSLTRQPWYEVPCCPSNLSRTFARLHEDILLADEDAVRVQQYISSRHVLMNGALVFEMDSQFPWVGQVAITIQNVPKHPITLQLRQPSWATSLDISLNGNCTQRITGTLQETFNPQRSKWISMTLEWKRGDRLSLNFAMPVQIYRTPDAVKSTQGMAALTCGPIVYCLESIDNPGVDIFAAVVDPPSITNEIDEGLWGGIRVIHAKSSTGQPLKFIPYHLWGNRGSSRMTMFVWVDGVK